MNRVKFPLLLFFIGLFTTASAQKTVFELSNGKKTATYFQVIDFYKGLTRQSSKIKMVEKGLTDAGYPLHVVMIDNEGVFDPVKWHQQKKVVIMINNGIHPGEPDGIDASMMLVRDFAAGKFKLPGNVALAFIPVYNIGGFLNRQQLTRISQDGPEEYGFRGNAQNYDLNRDFTKGDTRNSRSWAEIFHWLNPDIMIDNHVSDGADYQYVITLISTQYDKLGGSLGEWMRNQFDPGVYEKMKERGQEMYPYVAVEGSDPSVGFGMFYDSPRYSTGYAALFGTIAYMPETHMLKPYKDRVYATFDLMQVIIGEAARKGNDLIRERQKALQDKLTQTEFPLGWRMDRSQYKMLTFRGYEAGRKESGVSPLPVLFFDRTKPFSKEIKHYETYLPLNIIKKPRAYIIPQGWWKVIELLRLNQIKMERLPKDTQIAVTVYHIESLSSMPNAYEGHHRNSQVKVKAGQEKAQFLKGDYVIQTNQPGNRFLVEMLEPTGDDSYFSWNFFDPILQRKEGYTQYRWNDQAVEFLRNNPEVKERFDEKMRTDSVFSKNLGQQLNFIFINSPYYEKAYMRYPVYRVEP